MLDAYIIERIRGERDDARREDGRIPLHIEPPDERNPGLSDSPAPSPVRRDDEEPQRGIANVDFRL